MDDISLGAMVLFTIIGMCISPLFGVAIGVYLSYKLVNKHTNSDIQTFPPFSSLIVLGLITMVSYMIWILQFHFLRGHK